MSNTKTLPEAVTLPDIFANYALWEESKHIPDDLLEAFEQFNEDLGERLKLKHGNYTHKLHLPIHREKTITQWHDMRAYIPKRQWSCYAFDIVLIY